MLAGISTLCFGASYAVAFALELSRLFFRSGVRGALLVVFAAAGLLAHTLFLGYRAATATTTPLSSPFDWFLVAAWVLAATYLYLSFYHPRTAVGLFILPLVLALVGVAQFFASHEPFAETRASQIWGSIHGVFILLGTVAVMVGFVAGVMYLLQSYRLKHKQLPSQGLRLPNLEWLDHINSRAIVISALMLAAGFLSGTVLNLVNHRLEVDELPWSDPVIWTSSLLLAWLATAAIFGVLYRPARQGRKVAYLTVASFLFLLLALGLRLFLPSAHSPAREGAKPQALSVSHAPAIRTSSVRQFACAKTLTRPLPEGEGVLWDVFQLDLDPDFATPHAERSA
ncbi:MAG TPA: cytochrome c biogenesis protein CcsA [Pirellulales bacterium]|jgi:ABC-type transport system involved in cytochrome c biogenesis permease subunit